VIIQRVTAGLFVLITSTMLQALELRIKQQPSPAMHMISLQLSIVPSSDELVVYADAFRLSVTEPYRLQLRHLTVQPKRLYDPLCKRMRRMFTQPFTITMEACLPGQCQIVDGGGPLVTLSCLVGYKNGVIKPHTHVMALKRQEAKEARVPLASKDMSASNQQPPAVQWTPYVQDIEHERAWIHGADAFTRSVQRWLQNLIAAMKRHAVHAVGLMLLIVLGCCCRRPSSWRACTKGASWLVMGFGWLYINFFMTGYAAYYAAAALSALVMVYFFVTAPPEYYFIGRLKNLIGLVAGICFMPLLTMAYLLGHGF